jgi:hypothetical protein
MLSLGVAKYKFFAPLHQPSHPYFYCYTNSSNNQMLMQGGMIYQVELNNLGNHGITNDKKDFWLLEKKLVMLGC